MGVDSPVDEPATGMRVEEIEMETTDTMTETRPDALRDARMDPFQLARQRLWSLMEMPFAQMWEDRDGHPALADLEEDEDAFRMDVELPGIARDDVTVEIEGRRVIVRAQRKERERTGVVRHRERVTGTLRHEVLLPADVDAEGIEATLADGVLSIVLPKSGDRDRRTIEVR